MWSVSQIQKRSNEDRYACYAYDKLYMFAVFDGHGGSHDLSDIHCANYCSKNFPYYILERLSKEKEPTVQSIQNHFTMFDMKMYDIGVKYGSTCAAVIINLEKKLIYCINLGDSKIVLFTDLQQYVSINHAPDNETEKTRIQNAGGFVLNSRVNGMLAVSRAFGDYNFKIKPLVSSLPDVTIVPYNTHFLLLLTSDAPFENNAYTDNTLIELLKFNLTQCKENLNDVTGNMVKTINNITTDDITVLVVKN